MNSKPVKKSLKCEGKVQTKAKPKPKVKNKSKPKITKLKVGEIKVSMMNNTQRVPITPSSAHRSNNLTPHNYLSERMSINAKKAKAELSDSKLRLNCQIRMRQLVTEQDIISLSDEEEIVGEESYECMVNQSYDISCGLTRDRAATIIQKFWRLYRERNRETEIMQGKRKSNRIEKQWFQKTHKLVHTRKKSSIEVVDMIETKHLGDIGLLDLLNNDLDFQESPDTLTNQEVKKQLMYSKQSHKVDEEIQKLKREQTQKWNQIIQLISYTPNSDIKNHQLLRTLITKSEENKLELEKMEHVLPIDPSPSKSSSVDQSVLSPSAPMMIVNEHKFTEPLTERTEPSGFEDHPFIKIIQLQMKMMKDRLEIEIKRLDKKYKDSKLTTQVYQHKKQQLIKQYQEQEKNVLQNKSQINFSLEKAHDALLSSKRDASFLYRVTGKDTCLRHSLSDESVLLKSFIKEKIFVDDELMSCSSQSSLNIKTKRTFTQLEYPQSPQVIIEELEINYNASEPSDSIADQKDKSMLQQIKQKVETVQKNIQQYLINELCVDIYLNDNINNTFLPYYEIQTIYKFRKITDTDIETFLKTLVSPPFRPTKSDLLKRMNQKINPNAKELLRILRNQEPEDDEESQYYELVIPEQTFKDFREWKETSIVTDLFLPVQISDPIQIKEVCQNADNSVIVAREQSYKERKKKVLKFQKDLQAMYYKAVFNCFNEAIIEVKCSYSPFNGRSTISPGQLKVSLLDSNTPVSMKEVDTIVQKGKLKVLDNLKYKCPSLDTSSYSSLNRFQDALVKQIQYEFTLNQHKWVSFFDEYLEIATELTNLVIESLFSETGKEIYKMQLCRI